MKISKTMFHRVAKLLDSDKVSYTDCEVEESIRVLTTTTEFFSIQRECYVSYRLISDLAMFVGFRDSRCGMNPERWKEIVDKVDIQAIEDERKEIENESDAR